VELPELQRVTREGQDCERFNLLHPTEKPRVSFVAQQLDKHDGPVSHPPTT
jgi:pyruvate dehydrogenase E1 component